MNDTKYIGLDVHQATISVAVLDSAGKLVMEAILETKAETILQFIQGLRGSLHVTLEEGTCAAWLHDVLKPHVARVLVCDPRKNALIKAGNKSDRIDARKLADLYIGVGRFPARGSACTHHAVVRNGSPRSPKRVCIAGQRSTTSSSTPCGRCASKYDEIYWRKAANTRR